VVYALFLFMAKKGKTVEEALMHEEPEKRARYQSFGCTLLDLEVGGGDGMGFPFGYILNVVGDTSGGKSFIKNEFLACAYHSFRKSGDPFKLFSDDGESGDTFNSTKMYGVNLRPEERKIGNKEVSDSRTVEEFDAKLSLFLSDLGDGYGVYALDSLDGLSSADKDAASEARMENFMKDKDIVDKGTYDLGDKKFLSQQFFKTQANAVKDKKAILLIVSQVREKLNAPAFTEKMAPTGGKALRFYSHTQLVVAKVRNITKKVIIDGVEHEREIGFVCLCKTSKSKTPRPYREVMFPVYFNYGIDDIEANIDFLFDLRGDNGLVPASLAKALPWEKKKDQSKENCQAWLKENGYESEYTNYRVKVLGEGKTFAMKAFMLWLGTNEEAIQKFAEEFGKVYSKEELHDLCVKDAGMRATLRSRVIRKWEAIEDAIKCDLPGKYSDTE
jgi:RecA/RadA recombinase